MKLITKQVAAALAAAALSAPALLAQEEAIDPERAANTVILDETGVRNLGIETEGVQKREFETTIFAIGRIEEIPANRSVLSSRISGRAVAVTAFEGDTVTEGQVLVKVESRQPGNPPPTIELKAPKAGLVVESHVRIGEPVEPAVELLDISDRSQMWAIGKIPEKEAATVGIGTKARISIPALGGEPIEATLKQYSVDADRQAGTVDGIFQIANPDGRLQPGMRAEFSIVVGQRKEVIAVPRSAIQGDPSSRVVYVEDFDLPNAFLRVPVQLGEKNDRYVEILSGLFVGDKVVTRGSYSLGFAGGGSSISLKEALDAAHGHEHNEDGSEMTPEQRAAEEAAAKAAAGGGESGDGRMLLYTQIYGITITLMFLVVAQQLWKKRKVEA